MKVMGRYGLLAVAALMLTGVTEAKDRYAFSAAWGVFYPGSGKIRDAFGSAWHGFGFSPTSVSIRHGYSLDLDFDVLSRERGSNRMNLWTASFGLSQTYSESADDGLVPFIAARAGFTYADYNFVSGSITYDRSRVIGNANFEVGVLIQRTLRISARYDLYQKTDGLSLSGYSFRATYQLFTF